MFKNYIKTSITTNTTVITGPVGKTTTLIGVTVANTSGVTTVVSVKLGSAYIVKNATVTSGSSLVPIGGEQKVVMTAGQILSVEADYTVDVICSVLED